jgi:hypothetical protein
MHSRITKRFRDAFDGLPAHVQREARATFALWRRGPYHPSLRFKQVHPTKLIWSVRVGPGYRVLGVRDGNQMIWFWIGSHADYDRLVKQR